MTKKLRLSILYVLTTLMTLLLSITLVKSFWYPDPLMQATGINKLLITAVLVNTVLGLTFAIIIFNKRQKIFKKDIVILIGLQILCLLFSIYGLYKIRPVWIAYNVDRFELILNNDVVKSERYKANKKYENPYFLYPKYVGVTFSKDNEERTQNMFEEALNRVSIARRPERYVPFFDVRAQVKKRAQKLELLERYNNKSEVLVILKKYPKADSFVPLQAKKVDMTVLLNKENKNQIVAIVNLRPW